MPDSNENSQDPENTTPAPEAAAQNPQPTTEAQATEVKAPAVEPSAVEPAEDENFGGETPAMEAPAELESAVEAANR